MRLSVLIFISTFLFFSCGDDSPKKYELEVIAEYPHDVNSYTQGLFFHKGEMYETTGLRGKSTLRKVNMQTGLPLKKLDFDKKYFLEGSVVFKDNLYILTWDSRVMFVYGADSLEYRATWKYPREGWGLTTDGKCLYASDGSSTIYVLDENLSLQRRIRVKNMERPVMWLNELEYINPKDGQVEGVIDCRGLLPDSLRTEDTDVLNGIAYNPQTGKIYLTGKNWPRMYEVKLLEPK